jgi:hypothetical protein
MLETLSLISSKVHWLRPIVVFIGLTCLAIFCSSLFNIGYYIEEVYLIPSLAGFIWSLLLFIMLNTFVNLPIKSNKKVTFFSKIKYWFVRLGYRILTVIFLLMTVAGLILSFRLFIVWFAN